MSRLAALLLLALAACGDYPCWDLGERLCACTGATKETCKTQVQEDRVIRGEDEAVCKARLDTCHAPAGANFCEWLQTSDGKVACGLAPAP